MYHGHRCVQVGFCVIFDIKFCIYYVSYTFSQKCTGTLRPLYTDTCIIKIKQIKKILGKELP